MVRAKAGFCEDQLPSRDHRRRCRKGLGKSQKPRHEHGGARWEQNPQAGRLGASLP